MILASIGFLIVFTYNMSHYFVPLIGVVRIGSHNSSIGGQAIF